MSNLRYHPASESGWLAVATPGHLLVVQATSDVARTAALWSSLGQGFRATLDELTRNSISATPSFALLEWSGSFPSPLRVIVRGQVTVTVSRGIGTVELDGAGVSTWTEQSFADASGFDLNVESSTAEPWLPLNSGAVFATRISSAETETETKTETETETEIGAAAAAAAVPTSSAVPAPSAAPSAVRGDIPSTVGVSEVTMAERPAVIPAPTVSARADAAEGEAGYDFLFGETMFRNVAEAAVRGTDPDAEPGEKAADSLVGDHDGMTIMTGDITKLRAGRKAAKAAPVVVEVGPKLYLELSTGGREPLTQTVLVGRSPAVSKVSGGAMPRLVTIPGDQDISRNHAQFAVEGGTVVVTDLHSRNGTLVVMPGKPPQQLRQGEPTSVIVGTVVDLGGGVTLTVCEES